MASEVGGENSNRYTTEPPYSSDEEQIHEIEQKQDTNPVKQRNFIVFESCLLSLFSLCLECSLLCKVLLKSGVQWLCWSRYVSMDTGMYSVHSPHKVTYNKEIYNLLQPFYFQVVVQLKYFNVFVILTS